ncbi:hypothetical protein [Candidatus Chlorohelix sp.]|uniref:hypothetical protein n=1 Tax=Candidatus Chlorohelix sp. TaxID=3139201 RepID=UPI00306EC54F
MSGYLLAGFVPAIPQRIHSLSRNKKARLSVRDIEAHAWKMARLTMSPTTQARLSLNALNCSDGAKSDSGFQNGAFYAIRMCWREFSRLTRKHGFINLSD